MLLAGDILEHHLGKDLGLSTMGAAALGNMISGTCAIALHGTIEGFAEYIITDPELTLHQAKNRNVQWCRTGGSLIGIVSGSLAGMFPLLFMKSRPAVGGVGVGLLHLYDHARVHK